MNIQDFNAKLVRIEEMSDSVRNFHFELDGEIEFKAGQFINIVHTKEDGKKLIKPYSIASKPSQKKVIELCIKHVGTGRFTPYLWEQKIGYEANIKGSFGIFTLEKLKKEKVVFIAAGTGVAPFRSMAYELLEQDSEKEITLIFGIRTEKDILFKEEFEKLSEEHPHFKFLPVLSRGSDEWQGRRAYVQQNLESLDSQNSECYLCGLPEMVNECEEKLLEMGFASEDVHCERYT